MSQVIATLLAIFFIFASSIKLLGWQKLIFETQLSFFLKYGLNRAMMFIVGLIELTGALLLILFLMTSLHEYQFLGAGLLGLTSLGALFFHFKFDKWTDAVPAGMTLLLSLLLVL